MQAEQLWKRKVIDLGEGGIDCRSFPPDKLTISPLYRSQM